MATIEETIDAILQESQTPDFQGLPSNEQGLVVRGLLGQAQEFGGLGPADQAAILSQTLDALRAGPPRKGAAEFVQEVGLETVLPAAAGTAGTIFGGIPGGAAATMAAGQLAEFTRPALVGEPLRPLEEQITRRVVEGAFSVAADVTMGALAKTATATTNFVRNQIKKSLGIAGEVSEQALRAQRVAQRVGVELAPFQLRGEAPGGVLATFETVSLNSFGGEQIVARKAAKQVSAAQAYQEELLNPYVQSLTSNEFAGFIIDAVANRKVAASQMRKALYGQLREATPGVQIDLTDIVDNLRQFADVPSFQKALGSAMPEAFTPRAAVTETGVIVGLTEAGEPILEGAQAALTKDLGNVANRISQLRGVARTTKDEGVRNWATRAANDLNARALEQMPPNATGLWDAARGFAGAEADVLRNQLLTNLMRTAQQKPDALLQSIMRPGAGDTAVALKTALDSPIIGPGGQSIPGTNRWAEIVQPAISNALLDTIVDKSGNLVGGKLLTQLRGMSKKQVEEVLGRGTFEALKDLGSALEVAAAKPVEKGVFLVRGAQMSALPTASTLAGTGAIGLVPAAAGGAAFLLGPVAFARVVTNPSLMRQLAKNVRTPGKNFVNLSRFVGRLAALQNEEEVTRLALEEAESILNQVRTSERGAFIPPAPRP